MNAQKPAHCLKPIRVKSRDILWKAKEMVWFTAWLTQVVLTHTGTSIYAQPVAFSLNLALLLDAFFSNSGDVFERKVYGSYMPLLGGPKRLE